MLTGVLGETTLAEPEQHHESGLAFHQRADRRLRSLAEDMIAFPVARCGPVFDLGWSFGEEYHVQQLATAGGASTWAPLCSPRAQAPRELRAQRPAALHKQRLIDRLVRRTGSHSAL